MYNNTLDGHSIRDSHQSGEHQSDFSEGNEINGLEMLIKPVMRNDQLPSIGDKFQ